MDFRLPPLFNYPFNPLWISYRPEIRFEASPHTHEYSMARQGAVSLEEIIKNKVAIFRRWRQTKLGKRHTKWNFQFSIMTYNILSQVAVENHRYLYRHCSHTFLQEDYRISRILPEILNSKSDIICLQEVEQHIFDHRIKRFFGDKGFGSIFKKRTTCKTDGCAILWRKKKFDLLKHTEVEFQAKGNEYLNRDNVGLIAVLKPNHPDSGNTQLHVATTHLLFNPRRGEIKLCQLRLLLAELERMALKEVTAEERLYHPTILCGDFNIEPHSPLYQFIETGFLDVTDVLAGDLSGQVEGKNKGNYVKGEKLSLQELGISNYTRFEIIASGNAEHDSGAEITNSHKDVKQPDQYLIQAIGEPKDPRWFQTSMAVGQEQLTSEIAFRVASGKAEKDEKGKAKETVAFENPSVANELDNESNQEHFLHDFKFVPVYNFHNIHDKDKPVTSMTRQDFSTVDHIFYTVAKKRNQNTFTEGQLKLLGLYSLLHIDEMNELSGLPNAHLGSDHISLIAQFALSLR